MTEAVSGGGVSYRELLRVPRFARLAGATLLVRLAAAMWQLALLLFVLLHYRSPALAGVSVFLSIAPGVVVSPLAGALLDRYGRVRLMVADYALSALALGSIVVLARASAPLGAILLLVVVSSLTNPLGAAGSRSLFPLIVPTHLWDRANAVDSMAYMVTTIVGAPLAGFIVALSSPEAAIGATALVFVAGALLLAGLPDPPRTREVTGRLLTEAREGLVYVLRHRTLRGLALGLSVNAMASGILIVALPVLVLERGYGGAAVVGALWATMGVVGIVAGLIAGRFGTVGRERPILVAGIVCHGAGLAGLALAPSLPLVVAAVLLVGAGGAVTDVAMFSLRQRVTDPAWFGRAFAVSMHLNYSGVPIGSAASGPLLAVSIPVALLVAAGLAAGAALVTAVMVPSSDPGGRPS